MSKLWNLIVSFCGALGGLACVLTWFGIKPQDLWGGHVSLAVPHWLWLLFGLMLFAFSIGLSVYTFFRQAPAQPLWQGRPKWQRLQWANTQREKLEDKVRELENVRATENAATTILQEEMKIAKKTIKELEVQLSQTKPNASLRDRVFDVCKELGLFLDKYGPRPDSDSIPISDPKEFARRYLAEVQAWDNKFQADYWMNYKDKIINLRHELALANHTDDALDQRLNEAQTASLSPVTVREIDNGLRRLAAKL
jgi:hypothetical protein